MPSEQPKSESEVLRQAKDLYNALGKTDKVDSEMTEMSVQTLRSCGDLMGFVEGPPVRKLKSQTIKRLVNSGLKEISYAPAEDGTMVVCLPKDIARLDFDGTAQHVADIAQSLKTLMQRDNLEKVEQMIRIARGGECSDSEIRSRCEAMKIGPHRKCTFQAYRHKKNGDTVVYTRGTRADESDPHHSYDIGECTPTSVGLVASLRQINRDIASLESAEQLAISRVDALTGGNRSYLKDVKDVNLIRSASDRKAYVAMKEAETQRSVANFQLSALRDQRDKLNRDLVVKQDYERLKHLINKQVCSEVVTGKTCQTNTACKLVDAYGDNFDESDVENSAEFLKKAIAETDNECVVNMGTKKYEEPVGLAREALYYDPDNNLQRRKLFEHFDQYVIEQIKGHCDPATNSLGGGADVTQKRSEFISAYRGSDHALRMEFLNVFYGLKEMSKGKGGSLERAIDAIENDIQERLKMNQYAKELYACVGALNRSIVDPATHALRGGPVLEAFGITGPKAMVVEGRKEADKKWGLVAYDGTNVTPIPNITNGAAFIGANFSTTKRTIGHADVVPKMPQEVPSENKTLVGKMYEIIVDADDDALSYAELDAEFRRTVEAQLISVLNYEGGSGAVTKPITEPFAETFATHFKGTKQRSYTIVTFENDSNDSSKRVPTLAGGDASSAPGLLDARPQKLRGGGNDASAFAGDEVSELPPLPTESAASLDNARPLKLRGGGNDASAFAGDEVSVLPPLPTESAASLDDASSSNHELLSTEFEGLPPRGYGFSDNETDTSSSEDTSSSASSGSEFDIQKLYDESFGKQQKDVSTLPKL